MYSIVQFVKEGKALSVVPDNWIEENGFCSWPNTNAKKKIEECINPLPGWKRFPIKVQRSGFSKYHLFLHVQNTFIEKKY